LLQLTAVHRGIPTTLRKQFVMCATLHNPPVLKDNDLIRVAHCC
jgi:hypothetical protein